MRTTLCLIMAAFAVAGCASQNAGRGNQGLQGAVTQPLEDLNLVRDKIPVILRRASEDPYALPQTTDCPWLHGEVAQLDDALGPDIDVKDPAPAGRMAQGGAMVGRQAVDAVRDLSTGWIPMRNWVRRLTGAQQHSSQVQRAINGGLARRAYLKGMARSQGCPIVAASVPAEYPEPPTTPSSVAPQPAR
jgi:hypothetical protein